MEIYEKLWLEAATAFERNEPQIDPHLLDKANDLRRGVTVALRPSPSVRKKIKIFLDQLTGICPNQYFYQPEEFHVTVLSIISGTELWREKMTGMETCCGLIKKVLRHQTVFKINFRGVTASPNCVMIQGFPTSGGLEKIRDELRDAFAQNGFGNLLDRRYKIITAHVTVMRFCDANLDGKKLLSFLTENRMTDFGEMDVRELELVLGDWYASANTIQKLEKYDLRTA